MLEFLKHLYIIISFEKNMYQNLILVVVSSETVEEKRGKEDMKTVMYIYIFELELLLNFMRVLLSLKQKN